MTPCPTPEWGDPQAFLQELRSLLDKYTGLLYSANDRIIAVVGNEEIDLGNYFTTDENWHG